MVEKVKAVGTKLEVWKGKAKHTSGGLTKDKLMKNKRGKVISKKKHSAGIKAMARLKKLGYATKKGQFGVFKNGKKVTKKSKKSKKSKK